MNKEQVLDRLRAAVEQSGSQAAFARAHELRRTYLSDVLCGRRQPGPTILEALRLTREVTYRERGQDE
jgi:hypothetical protein